MAGCFGPSQYDRDMEAQLFRYLDEQDAVEAEQEDDARIMRKEERMEREREERDD